MQIGVDSFAAIISDPATGLTLSPVQRMQNLLEEIELADQVGRDSFGIGEHHRAEFLDSAPAVILGAAAARTKNIRLSSAVTVLSAADPVRLFQEFATIDLLSNGRAEMVVGRGSSIEAFPLFGFRLDDYDALFVEQIDLLLKIREDEHVHWSGNFRHDPTDQAADDFLPGFARAVSDIGKERGWPAMARKDFEDQLGPEGALIVGSPEEVVDKIIRHSAALGGISRVTFQMNAASLAHEKI